MQPNDQTPQVSTPAQTVATPVTPIPLAPVRKPGSRLVKKGLILIALSFGLEIWGVIQSYAHSNWRSVLGMMMMGAVLFLIAIVMIAAGLIRRLLSHSNPL